MIALIYFTAKDGKSNTARKCLTETDHFTLGEILFLLRPF